MNPEIKKQWTDALRSGEFEQGKDQLTNNGKYCCLGVLYELHSRVSGLQWNTLNPQEGMGGRYCGETALLPREVIIWAGLEGQCRWFDEAKNVGQPCDVSYVGKMNSLTQLNDDGVSFVDIANIIEAQL